MPRNTRGRPDNFSRLLRTANALTLDATDGNTVIIADTTTGAFAVTVPAPSTYTAGTTLLIIARAGATNPLTITLTGAPTVNSQPGVGSLTLSGNNASVMLVRLQDGNWGATFGSGTAGGGSAGGGILSLRGGALEAAATTALAWEVVPIDPTAGTVNVTTPANPVADQRFAIKNFTANVTAWTVTGNGTATVGNNAGVFAATDATPAGAGLYIEYQYDAGNDRWFRVE